MASLRRSVNTSFIVRRDVSSIVQRDVSLIVRRDVSLIVRRDVITILDPKSYMTLVPINSSLRFCKQQFTFSCSACITILCQFQHDFVPISCPARITILHEIVNYSLHFRVCPDLPKFRRH